MSKAQEDAEEFESARPYHLPHSGECGEECSGKIRFGVKGGNIISGSGACMTAEVTKGRRSLWTVLLHAIRLFRHRMTPLARDGDGFSTMCEICDRRIFWPRGSIGYDLGVSIEVFGTFVDSGGQPVFGGSVTP